MSNRLLSRLTVPLRHSTAASCSSSTGILLAARHSQSFRPCASLPSLASSPTTYCSRSRVRPPLPTASGIRALGGRARGDVATVHASISTEAAASTSEGGKPKAGKKKGGKNSGGKAAEARDSRSVTPKSEDYSKWYLDVVREAELADYGPVRGTMVVRPYGYALWEALQEWMNAKLKSRGVQNAYFPSLIPQSFLSKEAEHVEGFAPELAVVTVGGAKTLEEPLVVRPTSETVINHMFSQWIQSHRDLPMLINQWANVVRWEMRTRPFLRTLEFLWQEGHTAHASEAEAEEEALAMIRVYAEFASSVAGMPVVVGRKSRLEKFAGATHTYTIEAMMGDGKALQAGTSHNLGQNFAKAFDTTFLDDSGTQQHVYQTSWGMSTRMIGGIVMLHGDDQGLRLPPKMAPYQIVIVPILKKGQDATAVMEAVEELRGYANAAGIRVHVDDREKLSPGFKYNYWEMKGVPLRVEVGNRDVEQRACVTARRDRPGKAGKEFGVPMEEEGFVAHINTLLASIQENLFREAEESMQSRIVDVESYEELKAAVGEGKWARCGWAGTDEEEVRVKEETGATIRCFPLEQPPGPHTCLMTGETNDNVEVCLFAKSY